MTKSRNHGQHPSGSSPGCELKAESLPQDTIATLCCEPRPFPVEARLPFPPMESNTLVAATIRRQLRSRDRPGADTNLSTIAAHDPFDNVLYDSSGSHSGMHSTMRRAMATPVALALTVMPFYECMLLLGYAFQLCPQPDGRDQAGGGHRQDGAVGTVGKDVCLPPLLSH